jgi:hypothetical protein
MVKLAFVVLVAACGGRSHTVATAAMDRFDILGGELSVAPPIAAKLEANRPESIMGAAAAASTESLVRMREGDHHVAAIFRRMWLACEADPKAAMRALVDTWRAEDGESELVPLANGAALYWPKQPPRRGEITALGAILVCAGPAGLVSANVMVEGDIAPARGIAKKLAESIQKGSRPTLTTAARKVSIDACGGTLVIDTPAQFIEREEVGADFSVFRFQKVGTLADDLSFAIYVGHHPTQFAPSNAQTVELAEAIDVRRWEDQAGVHIERVLDRNGCIVHAFGVGALASEPVLRGMIAFRF